MSRSAHRRIARRRIAEGRVRDRCDAAGQGGGPERQRRVASAGALEVDTDVLRLLVAPVRILLEQALTILADGELRVGRVTEVETQSSPPGTVLAQQPDAGALLGVGGAVDLTVAKSPPLTTVPNVAGLAETEALQRLRASGLVPGARLRAPSDSLPAGTVISTQPGPGTRLAVDSIIEVTTSDGPARASVRAVTNRPLAEAVNRLRDQGFLVEVYEEANPAVSGGLVIRQLPGAGEEAVLGSTVMLWVSTGPDGTAPLPDIPDAEPDPDAAGEVPTEG